MIQNIIVYIILAVSVFYVIYRVFFKPKKARKTDCESCSSDLTDCQPDYSSCNDCPLKQGCIKLSDKI